MDKVKKVYKPREDAEGNELDTVTVYVKARRSVLDKLSASSFTVTADFENIVDGLNTIPLDITCNDVPSLTMEDMWCDLHSFKVELEDIKESTFVVSTREEGSPASGYQVGSVKLVDGDSIAIAGPESDMNKIGKVVISVNVQGLKKSKTLTEAIHIYDKNEEEFTASQMERLTIKTTDGKVFEEDQMDVKVEIWKVKTGITPNIVVSGTPASGYRVAKITVAPETIELAGTQSVLSEIGSSLDIEGLVSVDGAKENFSTEVNLKEYLEEQYGNSLTLEKSFSDIIAVNVQLEKIGTTTVRIPVSDITILWKPANMTCSLTPADYISLEIQPDTETNSQISESDISVTLDLSSSEYQTAGNYQVPLDVTLPEGYTLTSQASIAVNLTKTEQTTEVETETEE
jgi:YbbR domain-containing protein